MKIAAVIVLAIVLGLPAAGNSLPPGPFRLSLQTHLLSTRVLGPFAQARTYAAYNRPAYNKRIGTAVLMCAAVSRDFRSCREFMRLGSGTLIAEALVPAAATFYDLAIVGGTGIYSNTGGTISLQPIGEENQIVIGTIEAF